MAGKMKMDGIKLQERQPRDNPSAGFPIIAPRIWKVLIALALPFIMVCASYCENLERTSVFGAYIADTLLPLSVIGYMVLIITLRNRDL